MNVDGSTFTFKGGGTLTFKYDNSSLPKDMYSVSELTSSVGYLASTGKKKYFQCTGRAIDMACYIGAL